ncbi:TIGR03790 family protein [sulfur-oxidizing endosymbiont of Gigantopelta aegis]|uniref:TIGR03790 family protein n=1 Tax=sulfur-oxidizing endosymbiont of Gigantopelta aegis TaxID=2794934 RepID=UPI0018DBCAA6|nr:TIGR03790 family protein [sulfur-oxidizing endosymbiont of Gigantopelta aegis]
MIFKVVRLFCAVTMLSMMFSTQVLAACDDSLPAIGNRDDVLIIVNDNAKDSCVVGKYYAEQRGVGKNNIVHLKVPSSYFLTWTEFKIMRDQIIQFMRTNTFKNASIIPLDCPSTSESLLYCQASMEQIRAETKIKYLVMTRGVPSRVVVDGSTLSSARGPTSIDNYLRHWLVNYYAKDVAFNSNIRATAFADGRGMRTVEPAIDGELIVGRIDGLSTDSAKALVDRAIAAEKNGIYGKHYGSKFGSTGGRASWLDYSRTYPNQYVYGNSSTGWQYQHGIFGAYNDLTTLLNNGIRFVDNNQCLTHIDNPAGSTTGKSPQECVVKLTNGKDLMPGHQSGRQALVDNALVYLGSLDGQPTNGKFSGFMNWRRDSTCSVVLCKNSDDPLACEQQSTDVFKEINTQCAGVAEGFIGYNFQSYPVSFLGVWPTAWYQTTASTELYWTHQGGGDVNNLAFPEIINDSADGDGKSVWFGDSNATANSQCYSDLSLSVMDACVNDQRIIGFVNRTQFASKTNDVLAPHRYRISLKYKAEYIDRLTQLRVNLYVKEPDYGFFQVSYGSQNFSLVDSAVPHKIPLGNTDWVEVEAFFTIDPNKHATARSNCANDTRCSARVSAEFLNTPWAGNYDGFRVRIETAGSYAGGIGLDDVQIVETDTLEPIVLRNASFNEGHEQVSAGDHAANFLSRLNGTAFWGSVSHHQSGGHSFDRHPQETLIYFMRGLPLGDSVWFAERYNSGMLYGDPLYSPIAVKFHYTNSYDFIADGDELMADTLNGNDSSVVSTQYNVDYCSGEDFFVCDQEGSWQASNLSGVGGERALNLGAIDLSALDVGLYTLRLAVNSENMLTAKSQTFYDYYPVTVANNTSDFDQDGLTDVDELKLYLTNPKIADSDGDGLDDGREIQIGTNPNNQDTDGDGMNDAWEAKYSVMDPLVNDADLDSDNDGLTNLEEFNLKTNPSSDDTDQDGLSDFDEINLYKTSPILADTDRDHVNDGLEITNNTDPLLAEDTDLDGMSNDWELAYGTKTYADDASEDPDKDGADNILEYLRYSLPNDATSTPITNTLYVDATIGQDTNDGSLEAPFASVSRAMRAASDGDTIQLASGQYSMGFFGFFKSVRIQGPIDRSAELSSSFVFVNAVKWGGLYNLKLTLSGQFNLYSGRNITMSNVELYLSQPITMNLNTKMTIEHGLVVNRGAAGMAISANGSRNYIRTALNIESSTIVGFPIGIKWNKGIYLRVNNSILANDIDLQDAYGFQIWNSLLSDGQFSGFSSNLSGDPLFVDASIGDYHLQPASPGVDTGSPRYKAPLEHAGRRLNMGFYGNTIEAAIAKDSDGDTMPDGWEIAVGTNPLLNDSIVDADNDGVINLFEYRKGSHPLNANSKFGVRYALLYTSKLPTLTYHSTLFKG